MISSCPALGSGFASPSTSLLVPGIHVFEPVQAKFVDGRDEPGHDEVLSG
jgi:hypothetical protein